MAGCLLLSDGEGSPFVLPRQALDPLVLPVVHLAELVTGRLQTLQKHGRAIQPEPSQKNTQRPLGLHRNRRGCEWRGTYEVFLADVELAPALLHPKLLFLGHSVHLLVAQVVPRLSEGRERPGGEHDGREEGEPEGEEGRAPERGGESRSAHQEVSAPAGSLVDESDGPLDKRGGEQLVGSKESEMRRPANWARGKARSLVQRLGSKRRHLLSAGKLDRIGVFELGRAVLGRTARGLGGGPADD
jgi:hypothetical protein